MKKMWVLCMICLLLALVGCDNQDTVINYDDAEKLEYTSSEQLADEYELIKYDVPLLEGYDMGVIAACGEYVYYTSGKLIPMGLEYKETKIMQYNLETKEEVELMTVEGPHQLNELMATPEKLFWVRMKGADSIIECYDLQQKQHTDVKTYTNDGEDNLQLLSLATDGERLAWYELGADEHQRLVIYDIAADKMTTLPDTISNQSPFTRAILCDGVVSYVSEEGDSLWLNVFDAKGMEPIKRLPIDGDLQVAHSIANEDCVLWSKGDFPGEGFSLYAYSLQDDRLLQVHDIDGDEALFSFRLAYDRLFVIKGELHQIYARDIAAREEARLTLDDGQYMLGEVVDSVNFIALNADATEASILYIKRVNAA